MIQLGVNVDHVATVREARGARYPDPVFAGLQSELAGADAVRMHITTDRRHIKEDDVQRFAMSAQTRLALECPLDEGIRDFALQIKPADVCLVPDSPVHADAAGGFDVLSHQAPLNDFVAAFEDSGVRNFVLVSTDDAQIEAAARAGSAGVEFDARAYAIAADPATRSVELERLVTACEFAYSLGLNISVSRGLQYDNVQAVAAIETVEELNVGHAIIARALYFGLPEAVSKMKRLIREARPPLPV